MLQHVQGMPLHAPQVKFQHFELTQDMLQHVQGTFRRDNLLKPHRSCPGHVQGMPLHAPQVKFQYFKLAQDMLQHVQGTSDARTSLSRTAHVLRGGPK